MLLAPSLLLNEWKSWVIKEKSSLAARIKVKVLVKVSNPEMLKHTRSLMAYMADPNVMACYENFQKRGRFKLALVLVECP
jgi:hypothetical protein